MNRGISVEDIVKTVGGQLQGNGALVIESAAGLDEATEKQISFYHNPKYKESLEKTRAGAVLIPQITNGTPLPGDKTLIRVENPQLAFAQVLALLDETRARHPKGIHPKAVIDPQTQIAPGVSIGALAVVERGVVIGEGTIIYPGCHIGANSRIGDHCLLYANVVLREDTELGARVIIQPGAILGSDGYGFVTHGGRHHKIPQIGRVVVEDDVEIGANVTIDRATTGETRIGTGTKIDNLVHIAHNVQIGPHCLIVAQVGISGSTRIGKGVVLAGQVGIIGHLNIGDGAIIAAQSGIMNDVAPGEVLFGSPARPHREALKLQALFGKLPELFDAFKTLKKKSGSSHS